MIGMSFPSFIVLAIISIVVSVILHYGVRFYAVPGFNSFLGKWILGWLGGWLGSPVFGHWGPSMEGEQVFIIPAILGCVAALVLAVDLVTTARSVTPVAERAEPVRQAPAVGTIHPTPVAASR
jgi:uncharacterized membrane protein YeaQ/YmgE (transglycosylase-associated protein family)